MNALTCSVRFPVRLTSFALGLVFLLTNSADAQQRKDSRVLKSRLEKLEISKAKYEDQQKANIADVASRFDEVIGMIEKSKDLPGSLRIQLRKELTAARDAFKDDGDFTPITAFQDAYVQFALSSVAAKSRLNKDYDDVLNCLPPGDARRKSIEKEIESYAQEFAKFDALKVGTTYVGFRSDFDWGPVTNAVQFGNAVRLQRVPNPPVNVDFTLHIDRRVDQFLEGTITQNNGQFQAVVEGTYDGANLYFRMVRMVRGKPRYFEYSGQLVGALGKVAHRGIKTDGVRAAGFITLQRK